MKKKSSRKINKAYIVLAAVLVLLACLTVFKIYIDNEYKPKHKTEEYFEQALFDTEETDNMLVVRNESQVGIKTNIGLIFYSGEKINAKCYLPLMVSLSNDGFDCFLPIALGNIPILNLDGADSIIRKYKCTSWYIVAHSGACDVAAKYLKGHSDKIKGIIMLGGYSETDISDTGADILSVYGSRDTVMDMDKYEKCKENLPEKAVETVIKGGNHTAFADCNTVKGDTEASFPPEEQIVQTSRIIREYIDNN